MLPHKLHRGKEALERLKVAEGVPPPYDKQRRHVAPVSMRVLCLKPRRKYCTLGRISHEIGWKYQDIIAKLETKRKAKGLLHHERKKSQEKLRQKATEQAKEKIEKYQKIIEGYGYR